MQHAADQPHVMEHGQPAHDRRLVTRAERLANRAHVVEQVAVTDHHALGKRRRARGVLEKRQALRVEFGFAPRAGVDRQRVGRDHVELRDLRVDTAQRFDHRSDRRAGQQGPRLRALEDGPNPRKLTRQPRRVRRRDRHGDPPGVEAAEECSDEGQARRIEQDRAVALRATLLQRGRDLPRSTVEIAKGPRVLGLLAVFQVRECEPCAVGLCTRAQQLHERRDR